MSDIVERDIYEVANQLGGYVGPDTPERLKRFLLKEEKAAVALADEIVRLRSELANARNAALEHTAAMERAIIALSDWAVTYAPDMCSAETVEKSKRRIREGGATLAYIAGAIDMLHAALKADGESHE